MEPVEAHQRQQGELMVEILKLVDELLWFRQDQTQNMTCMGP